MVNMLLKQFNCMWRICKEYVSVWNEYILCKICLYVFKYDMFHDMIVISYV